MVGTSLTVAPYPSTAMVKYDASWNVYALTKSRRKHKKSGMESGKKAKRRSYMANGGIMMFQKKRFLA